MEKIHVKVDWCDKNYAAVTECEALNGVVAVTNKTYDGLMADLGDAVRLHVEGCVADGRVDLCAVAGMPLGFGSLALQRCLRQSCPA